MVARRKKRKVKRIPDRRNKVYLLHVCRRRGRPRSKQSKAVGEKCIHYLGTAKDLMSRLKQHFRGTNHASGIIHEAHKRGLTVIIARVWFDQDENFERALKNRRYAKRLCPVCNPDKYIKEPLQLTDYQLMWDKYWEKKGNSLPF